MELTAREIKYLQKLIDTDSDLDLEIILSTINKKRDVDNQVDINLVLSKLESLSNPNLKEIAPSEENNDISDSHNSKSKYANRAVQLQEQERTEDHINKTVAITHQILSELSPVIDELLIPKTPKKYTILSAKTQAELSQNVKKYIALGWQPLGGVSAAAFGISPVGGNQYIQAMVVY